MKRKNYNSLRQETHENVKLETISYKGIYPTKLTIALKRHLKST